MSFLVKTPSLPQSAAGADPKHSSGYKAADVVPLGWGRDIYPSKWISDKYAPHEKRSADGSTRQFCSIAAAYCAGPIDFIGFIFADGKKIGDGLAFNYDQHGSPEVHEFTLENGWRLIVHRGSENAAGTDADAISTATGLPHPPYRGVVWIEWIDLELNGGALPSLTVELGRYAPTVGAYAGSDSHPYGVNPFAAAYALCAVANGGDFDSGLLDPAHWGGQALALEAGGVGGRSGNFVHCHPSFTTSTSLGDALSQILAYVDGYLYAEEGQLRVGWFPSAPVDADALPEITEADLEAKPSGGGIPDWNEGPTSVVVNFRSFAKDYEEDVARYNAPANREHSVAAEPSRKERPFIHDAEQAALIAADCASDPSNGEISTNLTVLKSRIAALAPGDLVNWDYGPHGLDLVCRVTALRVRAGAASDVLTLTRERGAYPRPYVAPVEERVLPTPEAPGEIGSGDVRLYFLPPGFGVTRQVVALVNRPVRSAIGALLSLSVNGAAPWSQILDQRGFSARCTVAGAGIDADDSVVRVSSTSHDFARMAAQNAVAQTDDTLLLLIGDELLSVSTITSVATGTCDLGVLRARRGTTAASHGAGAEAWLFYRGELTPATHLEFYQVRDGTDTYHSGIATKHFKLALFTAEETGDAKPDDPGLALTLPDLTEDEVLAAYTVLLSSEAHTVACDSAGNVLSGQLGASGTARTTVTVLRNNTPLTAVASGPGTDQFAISLGTAVNATATKESNTTVRGDGLGADAGTIEILVAIAGHFTVSKVFTLTKARNGATGATGSPGSPGAGLFAEYSADGSSWHSTFTTGDLYRREKIGATGTWSSAIRIVGQDGAPGAVGTRGSRQFYRAISGAAWSNTEADAAIASMGVTKVTLDTVTLYKTSAGYSETRYWDGTAWLVVTQVIDGALIVHGTIGSDQIIANISLTTPLIMGGKLKLSGESTVCASTSDTADNAIVRLNGGGSDGPTRGGQVDVMGNEYTTFPGYNGSVLLTPGAHANGTVRLRDNTSTDRLVVDAAGKVVINSAGGSAALEIVGSATASSIRNYNYGVNTPNYEGLVAGGNSVSPSAVLSGRIVAFKLLGHTGSGFSSVGAQIRLRTAQNWSASACGSEIEFRVTPNNTTTEISAANLSNAGDFSVYRDLSGGRDLFSTGVGATKVGFLNAAGASNPQTFVGLYYDPVNNRAELSALSGGTAWRDVFVAKNAHLMFGTHATVGGETITGYITIKDSDGNLRKLAVLS